MSPYYLAIDDVERSRYTLQLTDTDSGFVLYRKKDGVVFLDHAEIPEALRGQSLAHVMMDAVLEKIESQGLKVIPVCGYTQSYFSKFKSWSHLLAT